VIRFHSVWLHCWKHPGRERITATNDWDVALSVMAGEPFCYFPDIICCTCIFSIVLKLLSLCLSCHVCSSWRSCITCNNLLYLNCEYFSFLVFLFPIGTQDLEWPGLKAVWYGFEAYIYFFDCRDLRVFWYLLLQKMRVLDSVDCKRANSC
jgi:hypothetical protein